MTWALVVWLLSSNVPKVAFFTSLEDCMGAVPLATEKFGKKNIRRLECVEGKMDEPNEQPKTDDSYI